MGLNQLAWLLATCVDAKLRNPARPLLWLKSGGTRSEEPTLPEYPGAAYYRSGEWKAAIAPRKIDETPQWGR